MRCLALLSYIFFIVPSVVGQNDKYAQILIDNECEHFYLPVLSTNTSNGEKENFSFRNIDVVDYRPDTSRFGLFSLQETEHDFRFRSSVGNAVSAFLNQDYTNPYSTNTLLVVIKKLWCSGVPYTDKLGDKVSPLKSMIIFRAEAYWKDNDSYIPFTYFDTTFFSQKFIADIAQYRLRQILGAFMTKVNSIDINSPVVKSRRHLSFNQVDSFSNRTFNYPIDTATVLHKGVYASVEDFRNNSPSGMEYEIQQDANGAMELHLKNGQGGTYVSRKMWGFCDGQQSYVMMDGNLFPILPFNRAYYIYGSRDDITRKKPVPAFVPLIPSAIMSAARKSSTVKAARNMHFFNLEIETGEIF